jgi:hypothetical protein
VKIELFTLNINPSMLFGFLILAMTAIDFILWPSKDIILEVSVLSFIFYSLITCAFSPNRFESFSWTLKVATWLLILLSATKLFKEEKDLLHIHYAVSAAVLIVILSFFLSWLGLYGEGFIYETGVVSYGAGFSSGKTLAYYLTISIPVLAFRTLEKSGVGWGWSYLLIIISLIVIVLTFVRAPLIALLIGFLSYVFFNYKYGNKSFLMSFTIITTTVLIIFLSFVFLEDSQYASRWSEMGDKYTERKVEKLGSGRVGGLMNFFEYYFYKAPTVKKIFGSGLGSSAVYLGKNKIIHNDFAEILMGCGLIGFFLYLCIILKIFGLLMDLVKINQPVHYAKYGIIAMSNLFIFLSFHMTNISSGVFILSVWALFTGASIGLGKSISENRKNKEDQLFHLKKSEQSHDRTDIQPIITR